MPGTEAMTAESPEELAGLRQQLGALTSELQQARHDEEQRRRALRREEALGRIRDQIIGLRRLEEVPGKLEEAWVGELRGLGIPIHRASFQFPSARAEHFSSFWDAYLSEERVDYGRLADYPWVAEVWASGQPVMVDWKRLRRATMPPEIRSLVEVPLPGGGSLGVNSLQELAFDEEAVQILQQVAGLLSLGIERLKEIEALRHAEESQRIELAVQRVRNQVLQMKRAEDWERVVVCFWMELKELVEFGQCSIDLVDLQRERFFLYQVGEGEVVQKDWFHVLPLSLKQAMETGEPVYRRNRKEMERCGDTIETLVNCCSVVDVPFLGGTFAINSAREDAFSPRDIQVLERFAQVLSEAHRRLEDLQNLALHEEHLHQAQKLEAIGRLATGVAHEINNPLTSVLGYSELLQRRQLDPQVRAHVETIYQEGQRAREIAGRLLQFVRRQKASLQVLSLNPLVEEVLALVRQQFELDHVQLNSALSPDLPQVEGHPGQLQQLLLSLLQNSREALQKTGKAGQIKVQTSQQGAWVRLVVEDDGPGIPAPLRERIFEPFFTTKEVGSGVGVGMGLSLCFSVAQEHGGRLWAEPCQTGACLVLELPAWSGAGGSAAKEAKQDAR